MLNLAVNAVNAGRADYVLYDGTAACILSDWKRPETFAGQKGTVVGRLDVKTKTIHVDSIAAAK